MKRYLLFGGHLYYPDGGAFDFRGAYDALDAAMQATRTVMIDHPYPGVGDHPERITLAALAEEHNGWWHIFDLEAERIVVDRPAYD